MKTYDIFLNGVKIGTTKLEKADASMGVVFGEIYFLNIPSPYHYLKAYCQQKGIDFDEDPAIRMISTRTIPTLIVTNDKAFEIQSLGNNIAGIDGDVFEITLEGVPYPFYAEEFPDHVKADLDRFN